MSAESIDVKNIAAEIMANIKPRLERALGTNDYKMASKVWSELCALDREVAKLRCAVSGVEDVIGGRNDEEWQERNPERWEALRDGTGISWDNIKEHFPEFNPGMKPEEKNG